MEEDEDDEIVSIVKPFIGSLRGFQVLKYIRDQNKAFIEEDLRGRTVHRLLVANSGVQLIATRKHANVTGLVPG